MSEMLPPRPAMTEGWDSRETARFLTLGEEPEEVDLSGRSIAEVVAATPPDAYGFQVVTRYVRENQNDGSSWGKITTPSGVAYIDGEIIPLSEIPEETVREWQHPLITVIAGVNTRHGVLRPLLKDDHIEASQPQSSTP